MLSDLYKPITINDACTMYNYNYNVETGIKIKALAKKSDESHIIFRGFPGSGKKTLAILYLKEKFATDDVFNIKKFQMECKIPGKPDAIFLQVLYTPYFYYLSLLPHLSYDKAILDIFITNIIGYKIVAADISHRIIIINNADLLSFEAQQSLRRTLETKINSCRFIFIVGMTGFLIDAIYSRCILFKIASPTNRQMFSILKAINDKIPISITNKGYNKIINGADGNIKYALQLVQIYNETSIINVKNDNIIKIITEIIGIKEKRQETQKGKLEKRIATIKMHINALMKVWQPDINIISLLFKELISYDIFADKIYELTSITSAYDFKMKHGSKVNYYIEGYCVKLLHI